MQLTETENREFAAVLANPTGAEGLRIALEMNASNRSLTEHTIAALEPRAGQSVIEVGPGNGLLSAPLVKLLGPNGRYLGVDISPDMTAAAKANLSQLGCRMVDFHTGDASTVDLEGYGGNSLFAVNLLYFIDDLASFVRHVSSWLGPKGKMAFGLRSRKSLEAIPFAKYGFRIRPEHTVASAIGKAGFEVTTTYFEDPVTEPTDGSAPFPTETVVFTATRGT